MTSSQTEEDHWELQKKTQLLGFPHCKLRMPVCLPAGVVVKVLVAGALPPTLLTAVTETE